MNKKKMIIVLIMSLVGIVLTVVFSQHLVLYVNSNNAKNYLVDKYDVDKSEIEYLDGRLPTVIWHNNGNIIGEPEWVDMSIKYKMNGKEFFVQRMNYKFYDDYQIYDIEELGTKWLQENIDESITGIKLESQFVYKFQKLSESNRLMLFSEKNIEEFLEYCFMFDDKHFHTCVYHKNILKNDYSDKICEKIKSKFVIQNEVYVCFKDITIEYDIYNVDSYWEISTITRDGKDD